MDRQTLPPSVSHAKGHLAGVQRSSTAASVSLTTSSTVKADSAAGAENEFGENKSPLQGGMVWSNKFSCLRHPTAQANLHK